MKNKIGWCNTTWNPAWGCLNNCEYCYARKMAKRFYKKIYESEFNYYGKNTPSWAWTGDYLQNLAYFKPTFLVSQFNKKFPKKPQRIFVGSMSEIAHWETKWVEVVLGRILCYPQHIFQFLTRHPEVYLNYSFPQNCWLGVTATKNERIHFIEKHKSKVRFISIEPLLEEIDIETIDDFEPNWIIIGAETGNRKDKIIPKKEWVDIIIDFCNRTGVPLYLKDSLKKIYPVEIKEFPRG